MGSVADTAKWAAAQRAKESARADRLFDDPLAKILAGEDGLRMLELSDQYNPQKDSTASYFAVRIKFVDDFAMRAAHGGVRQIVIPAAGMDTRAFRLDWPEGTRVYELDQESVLAVKEERLRSADTQPRAARVPIAVDLAGEWTDRLAAAGFTSSERSLWIVEGLLYYLEQDAVEHFLSKLSSCAAPGSMLTADLVSASFFTSPWTKAALEGMKQRGMAWRWGTDDPEALFSAHGWDAKIFQPGEEGANFGRWSLPVAPRSMKELPHSFLATAVRH